MPPPRAAQVQEAFVVETVTERTIARLPGGPLHWRIEAFPTISAARSAAGPTALAAEISGRPWLFTLGPTGETTPGGELVVTVGPVPVVPAASYLLRINRAGGAPGAMTPVHSHPGSEAFYVLAGQLAQRTPHGVARLDAGETMNGHRPGTAMQLTSSGDVALDQLVMFVVDAAEPFSSPASFEPR